MTIKEYRLVQKKFMAAQVTKENSMEILDWVNQDYRCSLTLDGFVTYKIYTHGYTLTARLGDYIIKDSNGDVFVRSEDEFKHNFKLVE